MPLFVWVIVGIAGWLLLGYLGRLILKINWSRLSREWWTDNDEVMSWIFGVVFGAVFFVSVVIIRLLVSLISFRRIFPIGVLKAIIRLENKIFRIRKG